MSVQLREPCIRSLRHLSIPKPWPFNVSRPRKKLTLQPPPPPQSQQVQGNHSPIILSKWPLILTPSTRPYTTSAALRSITEDVIDPATMIESKIQHTYKLKNNNNNKRNALKLWTQYQTTFLESKETLDVKQYDILLTSLVEKATSSKKTGFWARIIQAYEESRTLDIQPSPTVYLAAIKAYGRSRDLIKVTAIFKEFKKRYILKSSSYQQYLTAVLDCGELNAANRIFRDINSNPCISKLEASRCLAEFVPACIKKNNNLLLALKATESLSYYSLDWDNSALKQVTQSLWNGYSTLLSMPSTPITPLSVESFVSMYIEKAKTTATTATTTTTIDNKLFIPSHLFTMFNLICHHNNFVPTVTTCNLVLDMESLDHHFGRIKSILSLMQKLDIEPTSNTVSILLDTFGLSNHDIQPGDDVYNAFIKLISTDDSKGQLETIKGYMKQGQVDKAHAWLIGTHCIDLDCYAAVMESWITGGHWNKCIAEYDRLLKIDDLPPIDTNRRIVKAMLTARFAGGYDWDLCERYLIKKMKIKFTPTTMMRIVNTMLNLETKRGQPMVPGKRIIKALQMMETTLDIQVTPEGIGKVITALGKRGDVENGYRLYKWVRESSSQLKERCANTSIYRAMMASATKNNDNRRLERAWVDMQYRTRFLDGCEGDPKELQALTSYNILLNCYASRLPRPDVTRVKRSFQRLLKQNLTPDIVTYNILIKAFVNANNMEAANQIFRKMIQSGTQPDIYTTNTILNGWIIRKDWSHVENFVQELKSTSCAHLDIVTFNLIVQSFLHLDSKSMNYTHFLKHQQRWTHIKQLEEQQQQQQQDKKKKKMSSKTIWSIFESTTGYRKEILKSSSNSSCSSNSLGGLESKPEADENAFVKLFSNSTNEADQVTYKLFMKAFVNIGDYNSASKVYHWMQYRLDL